MFDIRQDLSRFQSKHLLVDLMRDRTTNAPITGVDVDSIQIRASKAKAQQKTRTRKHAEICTPSWICRDMIDCVIKDWQVSWEEFVCSSFLEITCGEAPFLVNRYDASTGSPTEIPNRIGILDRKLHMVNKNTNTQKGWLYWAIRAFQSVYGYELQGDNLLIARINILATFEDYLIARWNRLPTLKEYRCISNIITWNIVQMNGLTWLVPNTNKQCLVFDWEKMRPVPLSPSE